MPLSTTTAFNRPNYFLHRGGPRLLYSTATLSHPAIEAGHHAISRGSHGGSNLLTLVGITMAISIPLYGLVRTTTFPSSSPSPLLPAQHHVPKVPAYDGDADAVDDATNDVELDDPHLTDEDDLDYTHLEYVKLKSSTSPGAPSVWTMSNITSALEARRRWRSSSSAAASLPSTTRITLSPDSDPTIDMSQFYEYHV